MLKKGVAIFSYLCFIAGSNQKPNQTQRRLGTALHLPNHSQYPPIVFLPFWRRSQSTPMASSQHQFSTSSNHIVYATLVPLQMNSHPPSPRCISGTGSLNSLLSTIYYMYIHALSISIYAQGVDTCAMRSCFSLSLSIFHHFPSFTSLSLTLFSSPSSRRVSLCISRRCWPTR